MRHKMIKVKPFPPHVLLHEPPPPWLPHARAVATPRGPIKTGCWVKALHGRIREKMERKRRGSRGGGKRKQRRRRPAKAPWKKQKTKKQKRKNQAAAKRERRGGSHAALAHRRDCS